MTPRAETESSLVNSLFTETAFLVAKKGVENAAKKLKTSGGNAGCI